MTRFILVQDNDSHWFVIPETEREEWGDWRDFPDTDKRSWTPPDFAQAVGGSPSLVTFTDPKIG